MTMEALQFVNDERLDGATLILAFTGWMDGGSVSTGTVDRLVDLFNAQLVATVNPDPFYLFNFPGTMEMSSLFRPHIEINDGLIERVELPSNSFFSYPEGNLLFFLGKEPNLRWNEFGDAILAFADYHSVSRIIFVGSFGGTVPHTRQPRLYATTCDSAILDTLGQYGIQRTDYAGPGSFTSFLMTRAPEVDVEMFSIIAEIPSYLHGRNPTCIEAVTRRLAKLLGLPLDLDALRTKSTDWELEISKMVDADPDLRDKIRELENAYDNELIGLDPESHDDTGYVGPFDDYDN